MARRRLAAGGALAVAEGPLVGADPHVVARAGSVEAARVAVAVATHCEVGDRRVVARVGAGGGVEQEVGRAVAGGGDRAFRRCVDERHLHDVRRRLAVVGQVEGGGGRGVRGGHRRAGDRQAVHVAADEGRDDLVARREEIDTGAEVGVAPALVESVAGADRDRFGQARRRGGAGVGHAVAGRHGVGDAGADRAAHRVVERDRAQGLEADVGHRLPALRGRSRLVGLVARRHPLDAADQPGDGAEAGAVGDPHGVEGDALGAAVGDAADDARHVRAVAVAVLGAAPVGDRGEAVRRVDAAGEVGVRAEDAGVEDVDVDAGAVRAVAVGAVEAGGALVDAVEAPGGRRLLRRRQLDAAVLGDVGDAAVGGQGPRLLGGGLDDEALEDALEAARRPAAVAQAEGARHLGHAGAVEERAAGLPRGALLELDDVLPTDRLGAGDHAIGRGGGGGGRQQDRHQDVRGDGRGSHRSALVSDRCAD